MKKYFFYLVPALCAVSLLVSCSESTDVGSGLLGNEDLSIEFRDDFVITAETVTGEPVVTYSPTNFTKVLSLLGQTDDPIFGGSTYALNLVPYIISGPDFSNSTYDSIVLSLDIDTTFQYGRPNARYDIEVYEVLEEILNDSLYSDQEYQTGIEPIGVRNQLRISDLDSINIPVVGISTSIDSTAPEADLLRITLDNDLGRTLYDNLNTLSISSDVQSLLRGVQIRASTNHGAFAVALVPLVGSIRNSLSIYYRDTSEIKRLYTIPFGAAEPVHNQFINDISGSPVEAAIGSPSTRDELLYVKGTAGPKIKLDISDANQLAGTLINHASLEFFISNESRDTILFPNASFIAIQKEEDGDLVDIIDLQAARLNNNQISDFFGGDVTIDDDLSVQKYRMNVTSYVKDLLRGNETGEVFISILDENQNPETAILFGPNHSMFPAKLKITYTNP